MKQFRHISEVANKTIQFIKARKDGTDKSLRTRWSKFNKVTMGGIEPNTVMTIAGISGAGKSAIGNMLETDVIDLNREEDIIVLSFSFEMLSERQVGRRLSSKMHISTRKLYSADEPLSDTTFNFAIAKAQELKEYPIYYVDEPCTVLEMAKIIEHFQIAYPKKWLVVFIDHTLLISRENDDERMTINNLQKYLIKTKKINKTTIIQLAQLNREIEKPERINNPSMHYPMRSDLSSSDSMFQASDYVIVIHRPEILQIQRYGIDGIDTKNQVFLHFLKSREGEIKILRFINDLAFNNLIEPLETKTNE